MIERADRSARGLVLVAVLALPLLAALLASPRAASIGVEAPDLQGTLVGVQDGERLAFTLSLENRGGLPAVDVRMAATLPEPLALETSGGREWRATLSDLAAKGTTSVGFAAVFDPSRPPDRVEVLVTIAYRAPGAAEDHVTTARSVLSLTPGIGASPLVLALAAAVGALFVVGYGWKARSETVRIDQLFLIHDSGMLIRHYTNGSGLQRDSDILGGMLIVIQEFVRDSVNERRSPLEEMRFGDRRVLLARGRHSVIAALVAGKRLSGLPARLERAIAEFERVHGADLANWNGDLDGLSAADAAFNGLLVPPYVGRGAA